MAGVEIAVANEDSNDMIQATVVKTEGLVELVGIGNAEGNDDAEDAEYMEMEDQEEEDESDLRDDSIESIDPSELESQYLHLDTQYKTLMSAVHSVSETFMKDENLAGSVLFKDVPPSDFCLEQFVRVLKKVEDCVSKIGIVRFHLLSIERTMTKNIAARKRVNFSAKHITEKLQELSESTGLEDILSQLRVIFRDTGVSPGPLFQKKSIGEDEGDIKPVILDPNDDVELQETEEEMKRLVGLTLHKLELEVDIEPPVSFRDDGTLDDSDMEINDFDDVENEEDDNTDGTSTPVNKGYSLRNTRRAIIPQAGKRGHKARNINTEGFKDLPACLVCGKEFPRQSQLTAHMRLHTGDKPFKCQHCDKTFRLATSLKEHETIHTGETPFECKFCGRGFRLRSQCRLHQEEHEEYEKEWQCKECGEVYSKKSELKSHMKTHADILSYPCDICETVLTTKDCLRNHKLNVHGLNLDGTPGETRRKTSIECNICGKMIRKYGMRDHLATHSEVKPYACDVCNVSFSQRTQLSYHIRKIHNNEKNVQCTECETWFLRPGELKVHMKLKHPKGPRELFGCDVCGKQFKNKDTFVNHSKIHTENKKYQCDKCEKSYYTRRHLKQHITNYHSNASLDCEICGRTMICKATLKKHKLTHTKDKPHECKECGSKFRRIDTLQKHMTLHTSVRYSCGKCGEKMFRKTQMVSHTNVCEAPFFVIEGDPSVAEVEAPEEESGEMLQDIQFVVTTDMTLQ